MCLLQSELDVQEVGEAYQCTMSSDELNVIRYVAGYVKTMLQKFKEKPHETRSAQFLDCLNQMKIENVSSEDELEVLALTKQWIQIVDRGGLCKVNDHTLYLFVEIETCVQTFLGQKKTNKSPLEESFKAESIQSNGEVQYQWSLLAQDIDDSDDSPALLLDIINLWINVRRHAIVALLMEEYKAPPFHLKHLPVQMGFHRLCLNLPPHQLPILFNTFLIFPSLLVYSPHLGNTPLLLLFQNLPLLLPLQGTIAQFLFSLWSLSSWKNTSTLLYSTL